MNIAADEDEKIHKQLYLRLARIYKLFPEMTIGVIYLFISFLQVGFVIQCYNNYHIPSVEVINNAMLLLAAEYPYPYSCKIPLFQLVWLD